MHYHQTKDILYVMNFLGHKNIKNTLTYTQLVNPAEGEYVSKIVRTVNEARELVEAGFEYVYVIDRTRIFKKPK